LDLRWRQRQTRRAAINDDTDRRAMALAPGGDFEKFAESIGHGRRKVETGRATGKPLVANELVPPPGIEPGYDV
jgi:hypothetical protein